MVNIYIEKYKYIETESLKEFMLKNNLVVKGKNWVNPLANIIGGKIKLIKINSKSLYVIKM